jgi:hypothetical protein
METRCTPAKTISFSCESFPSANHGKMINPLPVASRFHYPPSTTFPVSAARRLLGMTSSQSTVGRANRIVLRL